MKLNIFICLVIIGVSAARVVREAPQTEEHSFGLENFMEVVQKGLKEAERVAADITGAANTDEMKQRVTEHLNVLTQQFKSFTDNVKQEAEKLSESQMVKELRETVDKHIADVRDNTDQQIAKFKEEHPETYSQIASHLDKVKDASSAIAKKIDDLAQSEDAKKLKETSLKFVDQLKEKAFELAEDLKNKDGKEE